MKRLVDESTDELTRSLLAAGIEHRPAPSNKAQVIVALGAGSAIGLFGSNAFAWLGTTAGKVTAAGIAVGVAGTLFVVVPQLERRVGPHAAVHSGAGAGQARPALEAALPARQLAPAGSLGSTAEPRAAHTTAPMSEGEALLEASEGSPSGATASSAAASSSSAVVTSGSDKAATKKLSSWRERRLAARRKAVLSRAAVANAASSAPAAASQNEPAAGSTSASTASAGVAAGGLDLLGAEKPDLDSEVRLVDDMHWAARRNDREALGRFLARYRETFPDGQLRKEVAEFATRLEQSDTSRAP